MAIRNRLAQTLYRTYPFVKGRGRLLSIVAKLIRGFELTRCRDGSQFIVDLSSFIDMCLFLDGSYEQNEIDWLRSAMRKLGCSIFIDIGAHIGVYTIAFGRDSKVQKVFSFEPDPRNHAQLLANITLNGLISKVKSERVAVSNLPGESKFYLSDRRIDREFGKINTGTSSLNRKDARHGGSEIQVEVVNLDSMLLLNHEKIAIKIDVEGNELCVLKGMHRILTNNRCVILCEVWADSQKQAIIDELLLSYGYSKSDSKGDNHLYEPTSNGER